jgi:hypothetical protein
MTHEQIKNRMIELIRKYRTTHDKEIIKELDELIRKLEKIEKEFSIRKV